MNYILTFFKKHLYIKIDLHIFHLIVFILGKTYVLR